MNIYQKLNTAREQFHQVKMEKSGKNTFAKYDYFTLSDFIKPALKVMSTNGLCATVSFSADIATMTIVNIEKLEEQIVITSPMGSALLKGCHEVQNIGAVETYQRRYLWVAALEIIEQDALDSGEKTEKEPPAFDLEFALKEVAKAKDEEWLDSVWAGESVKATDAKDAEGFKKLKEACKARKTAITGAKP